MIETISLTKKFDDIVALDSVSATIREGQVFGLIGTNGAGKSTFLRCLSGIYKPDGGEVRIDGGEVFEHVSVKSRFFFISDEQYFFPGATPLDMASSYGLYYRYFDRERFRRLLSEFGLDGRRKISTFSKGMKKQLSVILALSAYTDYIFCDETFDGLDPVMRQAVKSLFAHDMDERGLTPVIASHNLRELEDMCDHVGLLHKGGILLSKDIDDLKLGIHKIQCVFAGEKEPEEVSGLDIIKSERRGRLRTIIVRGEEDEVRRVMEQEDTVFYELIPLSLEEIFITETEVAGYDVKKLILGE
ncbi:MAG TPA: ABC transporter ATP-binding protein [Candidatus Avilachnospira avistercoris]|nr:ABC transporter ATP-binding protein [Candidatus Avilachnospira avistercoris]